MSGSGNGDADRAPGDRDWRRLAIVSLLFGVILLAAMVAPGGGLPLPGLDDREQTIEPTEPDQPPEDDGEPPEWPGLIEFILELLVELDGDSPDPQGCTITLLNEPVAGEELAIQVALDGQPLAGADVWYDETHVGQTDAEGVVSGPVGYERDLEITVAAGPDVVCEVERPLFASHSDRGLDGDSTVGSTDESTSLTMIDSSAAASAATAGGTAGWTGSESGGSTGSETDRSTAGGTAGWTGSGTDGSTDTAENATAAIEVDGTVEISLREEPHPGETVTAVVTIAGNPVSNATVERDGETVGTTDEAGHVDVRVPDDGTETIHLTATRGDFTGTATVDVLLLDVRLAAPGLAVVPGAEALVRVDLGSDGQPGATVSVDDERVGETDENGTLLVSLPTDPTASVTASAVDQRASTSVLSTYAALWPVWVIGSVMLAVLAALAHRRWGPQASLAVVATVPAIGAVAVAEAYWGLSGVAAVVGPIILVVGAFLVVRYRGVLGRGGARGHGLLAGLAETLLESLGRLPHLPARLLGLVLRFTGRLGVAVTRLTVWMRDRFRDAIQWLRRRPESVRSLVRRGLRGFGRWLRVGGRRVRDLAGRSGTLAVLGAVAVSWRAGLTDGPLAVGATLVAVGLAVVAGVLHRREGATTATDEDRVHPGPDSLEVDDESSLSGRSIRAIWRTFARLVAPRSWRSRTPGEIERAAIERGIPAAPARLLTRLFRRVEYGPDPETATDRERAGEALRAVTDADPEGGEPT